MRDTSTQGEGIGNPFHIFRKPRLLRNRLVLWNLMTFLLSFLILGSVILVLVTSYLAASLDKRLYVQSEKIQIATTIWVSSGRQLNAQLFSHLVEGEPGDEFAADDPLSIKLIDTRTGKTFYRFPNAGVEYLAVNQPDFKSALQGRNVFRTYQQNGMQQIRTLTFPLRNNAHAIIAVAQVGRSLASINDIQNVLLMILGGGMLVAALLASAIGSFVTNRELYPLSNLSSTLCDLSTDGLGICLTPTSSATEIRQLTDAFNLMTKRLEASFHLQRDFVADVSHELRTPLTAIRGQMDILLMNPALQGDVYQDVQHIHAEVGRVSRLLTNLLLMTRAEVGIVPELSELHARSVEVDTLLIEILRQLQRDKLEVVLEMGRLEQATVQGDRDLLKQMILNIVDNALHYTPAGGSVFVELTTTRDIPASVKSAKDDENSVWAAIHIRDTGPGIPSEDVPHIFEHYYRAAQSSARSKHGAGLGLFVSFLIARAHSGNITAESELMKGSCFHIWLPMSHDKLRAEIY